MIAAAIFFSLFLLVSVLKQLRGGALVSLYGESSLSFFYFWNLLFGINRVNNSHLPRYLIRNAKTMQLILDADDIDIKGNMSTIEQESLNEKFLANKIIDHLADDISSGNKENIQKQDNIIPDPIENDITDTDKEIATDEVIITNNSNEESSNEAIAEAVATDEVIITNNSNEENSNEAIAEAENLENLEEVVSQIDTCKIDPETVRDDLIDDSVDNIEEEPQVIDNVILEKEQNVDDNQSLTKDKETNIIRHDDIGTLDECSTQKENNDVESIIKEEIKADVDKDTTVKLTNETNLHKEADLDERVSIKVFTEEKELLLSEGHTEEVTNEGNVENKVDIDKDPGVNVITAQNINNAVEIDKHDAVLETTKENKENHVDEVIAVIVTSENNKEKQADVVGHDTVEVTTEEKENHADLNEDVNTIVQDVVERTDQTDIPIADADDKDTEMECSVIEPNQTNSLNENNAPIEIDDEDEKSIEKNSSPSAEVLAIDENMEVEELEETLDVQELDDNMESQELEESTQDKIISIPESKSSQKDVVIVKTAEEEPKRICKLSNNLEIFSDEDDEDSPGAEPPKDVIPPTTEKCINIDDDDDIMLIDEVTNEKDKEDNVVIENDTKITSDNMEPVLENTINENVCTEETVQVEENVHNDTLTPNETDESKITEPEQTTPNLVLSTETSEIPQDKVIEAKQVKKPLLPKNFIKTCKKNLADMTRDDLEDFCVLKIVESIVDRSNLGEIKSQLKNLTQTMDECKKKCLMLSKQNKDLQVVLKSVQEEQKSGPDVHVIPFKITRSVGMQVVMMVDKTNARKKSVNGVGSPAQFCGNNTNNKQTKPPPSPNNRNNKEKNTNIQQIPVPRLVPAVTTAKTNQTVTNNIIAKHNINIINTSISNGVRNSPPVQKPTEKRPRSQAVTVDLTDDEPPAKLPAMQRGGVNQTMRVSGPPQNIIQPQRFSAANINSPRKVYIPISGAQAQNVRAGQTIMVKTVPPIAPRPRCQTPHIAKVPQNTNSVRMSRIQPNRHPAPLPDAMKQYQPPNWKALPPAPDLKLSKVENGIVISWRIDGYQEDNHEEIASYQLYAYQETTAPPSTTLWKKIGDVKALPLPMACTLTQFMAGYKYYFAVRAVDIRTRFGPFSLPGSILLLNKM